MTITRTCSLAVAVLALALGAGACGGSDEDKARASLKEWLVLDHKKDPQRTCALMTTRAQAQIVGMLGSFTGADTCLEVMRTSDSADDEFSARDLDKAKIAVRGDLAVVVAAGDEDERMGLRKIDGEWRLDNMINPTLDERARRIDPRLSKGSDEQQLRATYKALSKAFAEKDYTSGCELFSYGAEAQLLLGRLFASFADTAAPDKAPDLSCAASMRALSKLGGGGDDDLAFSGKAPSAAALAKAKISIHGKRATVAVKGEDPGQFIREEGHWLVAAEKSEGWTTEPAPTAASLERCWRRAGAAIASDARDLRFAVGSTARNVAISPGRVSVKGEDWRVFYTLPSDGEDPGLAKVLAKPGSVRAVGYVKNAPAHAGVVAKARACGV